MLAELLREQLEVWDERSFEPYKLPEEPAKPVRQYVEWGQPGKWARERNEHLEIEEARAQLIETMREYVSSDPENTTKLIAGQPGLGKTHAIIEVAQELAAQGKRVAFFMDRHDMYNDLSQFKHFDPSLWYHWLSTSAENPDNADETMCRYCDQVGDWTSKGYPLMEMCKQVCGSYMAECPYRLQAQRPERIIAGVHEHAVTGMSITDYHTVIVDELPMRAFLQVKHIPAKEIYLESGGPVHDLLTMLQSLSRNCGKYPIKGKALLDIIGPLLSDVYAQVDDVGQWIPTTPMLGQADDTYDADYWYLQDMLKLLIPEVRAWEAGWDDWLARVIITSAGLDILLRASPWAKLPKRLIVLDATGEASIYRTLFERDIDVWKPVVKRTGRVYQATARMNGISTVLDKDKKMSSHGEQLISIIKAIIERKGYKDPGVITFKGAEADFKRELGTARVTHFYGQRGTNNLNGCDVVFIAGCPSPNDFSIVKTYAAMNPDIMRPFSPLTDDGRIRPVRTAKQVEYQYLNSMGQSPRRLVSGFWWEPSLQSIYKLFREDELFQALHRGRPLTRDVDIWIMTNIPLNLPLDAVFDDIGEIVGAPLGIHWQNWLVLSEWLKTQDHIDIESLAEATGRSKDLVSRQKWLDKIVDSDPERWQITAIKRAGRGRPKRAVIGR